MEPIMLSVIAVEMMKAAAAALASGVTSRLMEVVWPTARASGVEGALGSVARGTASRAEEEAVRAQLAAGMGRDDVLRHRVQEAINDAAAKKPDLVGIIAGIAWDRMGLSEQQRKAQRAMCPVGNHLIVIPPKYRNADGTPIVGLDYTRFSSMPRTAIAICGRGHTWPVFSLQS